MYNHHRKIYGIPSPHHHWKFLQSCKLLYPCLWILMRDCHPFHGENNYFTSSDPHRDIYAIYTVFYVWNMLIHIAARLLQLFAYCTVSLVKQLPDGSSHLSLAFYLTYILAFQTEIYRTFWHSIWHIFWHSILRSSGAHWAREVPGWCPAVPTGLEVSPVEVQ